MNRRVNIPALVVLLFVLIGFIWGFDALRRIFNKSGTENAVNVTSENTASLTEVITEESTVESAFESVTGLDTAISETMESQKYDNIKLSSSDVSKGLLVLVNGQHSINSDTANLISFEGKKNEFYRMKSYDLLAREEVINSLNVFFSDFYSNSSLKNILIMETYNQQAQSDLKTGYSLKIRLLNDDGTNSAFTGSDKYSWMLENCFNYGFIIRYPQTKSTLTGSEYDPSYLRYIGLPHSLIMKENGLCLEEYIEFLKGYSVENPFIYQDYSIYYIKSNGSETDVPVLKNTEKSISGNNVDGFIITCKIS